MEQHYCPVCKGTGKSTVAFDAMTGSGAPGLSDAPVCSRCGGTGLVSDLRRERETQELFTLRGVWSRLWRRRA